MKRRLAPIMALLLAILALGEAPAFAQDASARAEGRALFDEGVKLLKAGRAAEACPTLEASLRRLPGIGTRGKLAECYEAIGRTASAWAMYKEVESLADKSGDKARASVAAERAARLEPTLSHLTVVAPAREMPGLTVKRNGEPVERAIFGVAIAVDPGTSTFEVSAPGRVIRTIEQKIEPGASVTFAIPALAPAPASVSPESASLALPPSASPPTAPARGAPANRWVGVALGGAGVVALAVSGGLALSAKLGYEDAFNRGLCERPTKQCDPEGKAQTDGARTKAGVATGLLAAGAVLAVSGVVLFVVAPKKTALRVSPTVGLDRGGVTLSGGF